MNAAETLILNKSDFLIDSLNYSLKSFDKKFKRTDYVDGFLRYEKYERQDIHKILNWPVKPVAQNVGGYKSSGNGREHGIHGLEECLETKAVIAP